MLSNQSQKEIVMKNKRLIVLIVVLLALLSLACNAVGRATDPPPTDTVQPTQAPPTDTPVPADTPAPKDTPVPADTPVSAATPVPTEVTVEGASLEIINQSGQEIWYVFISLSDAEEWGDDWLGGDIIPDGESYILTGIAEGIYDVLAEDADENAIETLWEVEITGENTWTVTAVAASLEVVNGSLDIIAELYVSPSTSDSWGDDWLGGSAIKSGGSFIAEGLANDTYDARVVDGEGNVIESIYNMVIDGEYFWNISGRTDLPDNAVLRFEDDFSDNRNKWAQTAESADVYYMPPEDGEFCILIKATDLTAWEWYVPFRPDEFVAEVACIPDDATDATCGLGFGPDGDNLYWYEVSPSDQKFALFLLKDDAWQEPLIEWTESKNILPSGWNYLSMERLDGYVSVLVNGVLIGQVESNYFPTGRIGIGGATYDEGNVTVCLDDLRVWRVE